MEITTIYDVTWKYMHNDYGEREEKRGNINAFIMREIYFLLVTIYKL